MDRSPRIPEISGRPGLVRFGIFEADLSSGELRKAGIRIKLQDQPFRILALLLENAGQVTTREEIQKRIWAEAEVDFEHGLGRAINKIRDALGDSADNPRFIETLTRRGYRFIAPVMRDSIAANEPGEGILAANASLQTQPAASVLRRRSIGLALLVAGVILAAALYLLWQQAQYRPPRLLQATQMTESGRVYPGELVFESFPTVLTDGNRLYFLDMREGQVRPVSFSVAESNPHAIVVPAEVRAPSLADISPSGSQLLIRNRAPEIEQPIWVVPPLGGGGRRVGNIMAHDATWAPDGRSIVYATAGDIFIADADGSSPKKLGSVPGRAFWLRWSPDGKRLRFTLIDPRSHSMKLWEMSADGRSANPLFPSWSDPPAECCGNWTPDGRHYVFQATRDGMTDIWVAAGASSRFASNPSPSRLTSGPLSYLAPVPSRDGRRLYVVGAQLRSEILALDSRRREFTPYLSDVGAVSSLELSKDKEWAAWVSSSGLTLWRSRIDGSQRLQLTSPPMQVYMMRWSPDGRQIVFMGRVPGKVWKLYTVPAQGGTAKELMSEDRNEADPTWSPDGQSIAFGRLPEYMAEPSSPKAIYIFDVRSGTVSALPNSEGYFSPRWSPDGGRIAAMPLSQDSLAIYSFTTQHWTSIAHCSVDNPVWSADGSHVYFRSFMEDGHPTRRVQVSNSSMESVLALPNFRRADIIDYSLLGLGRNDTPIVQVRLSTADVYSLEWQLP